MNAELNEPSEHDSDSGKDNASPDGEPSASIGKNESKSSGSKGKKKATAGSVFRRILLRNYP